MDDNNPYNHLIPGTPISNHENFLQKAIKSAGINLQQGVFNFPSQIGPSIASMGPGGVGTTLSGAKDIQEGLPNAMQLVGNMAGGDVGLMTAGEPELGAAIGGTAGRTVGEAGRQGINALFKGQQPSTSEFGKETLTGAATETGGLAFNRFSNALLSGPAGQYFKERIGSTLGALKDKISQSGFMTHVDDIVQPLRNVVEDLRSNIQIDPTVSRYINRMADDMENVAESKGGMLEPIDIMNAQKRTDLALKGIGVYGSKIPKDYEAAGQLAHVKGILSDWTQGIANDSGIGSEYSQARGAYANIADRFPPGQSKHGILKNILEAGGIHNIIRGDIPGAVGSLLSSEAIGSNPLIKGLFNVSRGVGTAGPTVSSGVTDYIRKKS